MRNTVKRIKVVRGYQGLANFHAEVDQIPNGDGDLLILGTIPRRPEIPSPYAYAPEHQVMRWNAKPIIIVETGHRRFEVFEVSGTLDPLEVA
jgi:hypothetical protein